MHTMTETHTPADCGTGSTAATAVSRTSARFTAERDRDFLNLCRHAIRNSPEPLSEAELVSRVIHGPAPSYYVDYDYALHIVPRIGRMSRDEASRRSHGRWLEIYDRAREALADGHAASMTAAIAFVLAAGRASRFFISEGTAINILRQPDHRLRNSIGSPKKNSSQTA